MKKVSSENLSWECTLLLNKVLLLRLESHFGCTKFFFHRLEQAINCRRILTQYAHKQAQVELY
jgi:hypothetical protein